MRISRRQFLQSLVVGPVAAGIRPPGAALAGTRLGRVAADYLRVYARPDRSSATAGWKIYDEVVPILADLKDTDGDTWHDIGDGYVLAWEVQPVQDRPNVARAVPAAGALGEVTVPFVDARRRPALFAPIAYRLYYSATIWVRELTRDAHDLAWYKLYDDRLGVFYYAPASAFRLIPSAELAPIAPDAAHKHLVVNLAEQRLTAYEGRREVFSTLVACGRLYLEADGITRASWTPTGQFTVDRKRPSRHMGHGEAAGSNYELPGVPWVSYFHWKGYAFHGTWWHNAYGRPRSAGCVNMRSEEARWLYRWSLPVAHPLEELTLGEGTRVQIIEA